MSIRAKIKARLTVDHTHSHLAGQVGGHLGIAYPCGGPVPHARHVRQGRDCEGGPLGAHTCDRQGAAR